MKAILKNYRQSPRKVRLVASSISGKSVQESLAILQGLDKKVSLPMTKLINSAVSNAKSTNKVSDNLVVKRVCVNEGITMHRYRPRARGSTSPLRKRTSIISVELQ